jgi:hypothetical protein
VREEDTGMKIARLAREVSADQVAEMMAIRRGMVILGRGRMPILIAYQDDPVHAQMRD